MGRTVSGNYSSPSFGDTIYVVAPQRGLKRALATSLVLIVANTTTEAEAAKPKTFDVSLASTSAASPSPIGNRSAGKLIDQEHDRIITKIREIGMLDDGWHREDSVGATSTAVDEAERFARSIDWRHHAVPAVSLTEDGEINLLWQTEALYLDLGFVGDGTYTFYGKSSDGQTFLGDDLPIGDPLPGDLRALMSIPA